VGWPLTFAYNYEKGCLIAASVLAVLIFTGIAAVWIMADMYERRPKQPGEAECSAAEDFICSFKDREAAGNTPEATEFAEDYARKLRISREVLFTEGKAGSASLTQGYFMTFCSVKDNSLVLPIHVPELRRYADDAQVSLS